VPVARLIYVASAFSPMRCMDFDYGLVLDEMICHQAELMCYFRLKTYLLVHLITQRTPSVVEVTVVENQPLKIKAQTSKIISSTKTHLNSVEIPTTIGVFAGNLLSRVDV